MDICKDKALIQKSNFPTENLNIKNIKYREEQILYINHWPTFKDYTENFLLKKIDSLKDFLIQEEIPFFGISIDKNIDNEEPLIIVHLYRESRGFDFNNEIPDLFENIKIIKIIQGKYKEYEYK